MGVISVYTYKLVSPENCGISEFRTWKEVRNNDLVNINGKMYRAAWVNFDVCNLIEPTMHEAFDVLALPTPPSEKEPTHE